MFKAEHKVLLFSIEITKKHCVFMFNDGVSLAFYFNLKGNEKEKEKVLKLIFIRKL